MQIASRTGYTLYFVMLFVFVLGMVLVTSIVTVGHARVLSASMEKRTQAQLLALSGIERTAWFLNGGDGHGPDWETDSLFEQIDERGTVTVRCRIWGLQRLLSSVGTRIDKKVSLAGVATRTIPQLMRPQLVVTSTSGSVVLVPGAIVRGSVALQHGSIKKGSNSGPPDLSIPLHCAPLPRLPFLRADCDSAFAQCQWESDSMGNPPVAWDTVIRVESYTFPPGRTDDCLVFAEQVTVPAGSELLRCAVRARRTVTLAGDTRTCLFCADSGIDILGGVHESQFFSHDTVRIAAEVSTGPMCVVVAHRPLVRDTLCGGIVIAEQCTLSGTFVCYADTAVVPIRKDGPSIAVGAGSRIDGVVVTDGDCLMRDVHIRGHLWTRGVVTTHADISYLNWLYGMRCEPPADPIRFPFLGDRPLRVNVARCAP